MDVTEYQNVKDTIKRIRPEVIIHTAGLTNVELCESDPDLAYRLHVEATGILASVATMTGSRLVHVSTDHLFNGQSPWKTEIDQPEPLNNYARTKWQAEQAAIEQCPNALIVRTNFFGWGTSLRSSFSDWILRKLDLGEELTMFTDVFFSPILVNHLGGAIFDLVGKNAQGIFNVAGDERLSKYEFALKLADIFGYSKEPIRPTSVRDFPFKAQRPGDMSLSCAKVEDFLDHPMPTADDGLKELLELRHRGWPEELARSVVHQPTAAVNTIQNDPRKPGHAS
jgi:dTDP-4-dehydrorhamnose reductase